MKVFKAGAAYCSLVFGAGFLPSIVAQLLAQMGGQFSRNSDDQEIV